MPEDILWMHMVAEKAIGLAVSHVKDGIWLICLKTIKVLRNKRLFLGVSAYGISSKCQSFAYIGERDSKE